MRSWRAARRAQAEFEAGADQRRYDRAAQAAAWAVMEPARNRELAEPGGRDDRPRQCRRQDHARTTARPWDCCATSRTLRTCGSSRDPERGLTEIARPIGVIGAVVPSTNPVATPVNNVVNALKCGNAIVLSPSPKGVPVCERLLDYMHAELDKIGLDRDLVQMVPAPSSKVKTQRLMETRDLVVVTGSQDNVRAPIPRARRRSALAPAT